MDVLITLVVFGVPALALWIFLFTGEPLPSPRPSREGEARPWEQEAERAERRRLNAFIEEEMMRRAA